MQWNLIILRKELKLNQTEMAKKLGMNKDTYGRKERGEYQFTLNEMFSISNILDKPIDEIFLPRDCINNAVEEESKCNN